MISEGSTPNVGVNTTSEIPLYTPSLERSHIDRGVWYSSYTDNFQ